MNLDDLEKALAGDRALNEFDERAVQIVSQLIVRVRQARLIIADEGPVAAKESGESIEHPAVKVERMASAEIRGWVKERPDLFGARSNGEARESKPRANKFGGFKVVGQ